MANSIVSLGDSSILIQLGDEIDLALNRRVHALDARLRLDPPAGVIELVPAYASLLVHYDPLIASYADVVEWLRPRMESAEASVAATPRHVEVPVRYGGASGPDLPFVASFHRTTIAEIVRLHTSRDYTVFMMGFTPGFPYMGTLDEALATPRLQTPRTRVPAGSVGIAGLQTGIYPVESPGGWQIIGCTALQLLDLANATQPFLFGPGDTVRFLAESVDA